jgi:hypothetical protein
MHCLNRGQVGKGFARSPLEIANQISEKLLKTPEAQTLRTRAFVSHLTLSGGSSQVRPRRTWTCERGTLTGMS